MSPQMQEEMLNNIKQFSLHAYKNVGDIASSFFSHTSNLLPPELQQKFFESVNDYNALHHDYITPVEQSISNISNDSPEVAKKLTTLYQTTPLSQLAAGKFDLAQYGLPENLRGAIQASATSLDTLIDQLGVNKRAFYDPRRTKFFGDKGMQLVDMDGNPVNSIFDQGMGILSKLTKSRTSELGTPFNSSVDFFNTIVEHLKALARQHALAPVESKVDVDPATMNKAFKLYAKRDKFQKALDEAQDGKAKAAITHALKDVENQIFEITKRKYQVKSDSFDAQMNNYIKSPDITEGQRKSAELMRKAYTGELANDRHGFEKWVLDSNHRMVSNHLSNSVTGMLKIIPDILRADASTGNIAWAVRNANNDAESQLLDRMRLGNVLNLYREAFGNPLEGKKNPDIDGFLAMEAIMRRYTALSVLKEQADRAGIPWSEAMNQFQKGTEWGRKAMAKALHEVQNAQGSVTPWSVRPIQNTSLTRGPATLKGTHMAELGWLKKTVATIGTGSPVDKKRALEQLSRWITYRGVLAGGQGLIDPKSAALLYSMGADKIPVIHQLLQNAMTGGSGSVGHFIGQKTGIDIPKAGGAPLDLDPLHQATTDMSSFANPQRNPQGAIRAGWNALKTGADYASPPLSIHTPVGDVKIGLPMLERGIETAATHMTNKTGAETYKGVPLPLNPFTDIARIAVPGSPDKDKLGIMATVRDRLLTRYEEWKNSNNPNMPEDLKNEMKWFTHEWGKYAHSPNGYDENKMGEVLKNEFDARAKAPPEYRQLQKQAVETLHMREAAEYNKNKNAVALQDKRLQNLVSAYNKGKPADRQTTPQAMETYYKLRMRK